MKTQKIKKILITGSSGTIGTRLFETLLERGYQVIGFDKTKNKWRKDLNELTIIGDLLKKEDIRKIPKDINLVIHLAANARVFNLVKNPDLALDNIKSTYNILDFIRKNNIKNIIFPSSREVYGNRKKLVSKEDDVDLTLCESVYSASKISGEVLIYSFAKCYDIKYIICRFSNVYGMYDTSERFIPILMERMKEGKDFEVFGKDKILDFTYIDDCIDGVIKCVENFNKANGNTFNIAKGKGEKLLDIAKTIKKELNSKSKIVIGKSRKGEVIKYVADISKAKKVLKYNPKYSIKKGLELSLQWYSKIYGKK